MRLSQIPGAVEAVQRVDNIRNAAFLDLPTIIGGKAVVPMSIRHWVILDGIDSPFLCGRLPQLVDVPRFLWVLSPQFTPAASRLESWQRWRFIRSCRKLDFPKTAAAIFRYVKDTFQDSPPSSGGNELPQIAFAANIVSTLALNFHWEEQAIVNMPLKRSFQYLKAIRHSLNPDASKWNPFDREIREAYRNMPKEAK